MNRLAEIHRDRTSQRRLVALECARRVMDRARREGIDVSLIGSLAEDRFGLHSDVDFFVHGRTDPARRVLMERLAAFAFNGTGIPYDLVYASDLERERAQDFLNA